MTRPPVDVRRAAPQDLDTVALLWCQAREEAPGLSRAPVQAAAADPRPRLLQALRRDDVVVLVARLDDDPVGLAVLRVGQLLALTEGVQLSVEHLFVVPGARRRGVGRALLAATLAVADRSGADRVVTSVSPGARETHRFLARLGFSPLVVRRVAATSVLRRRLAGDDRRSGLEELLSRRRSLRARKGRRGDGVRREDVDLDVDVEVPAGAPEGDVTQAEGALPTAPELAALDAVVVVPAVIDLEVPADPQPA